jgi:hypothetical protein
MPGLLCTKVFGLNKNPAFAGGGKFGPEVRAARYRSMADDMMRAPRLQNRTN